MTKTVKRAPRMRIIPEELDAFCEALEKGLSVSVALKSTSWSKSSYYYKMQHDKKFSARVNASQARWYTQLSNSNFKLVELCHPETVKHNVQRMDRANQQHDYKNALITAQMKAISECDFEKAQRLQTEIEKVQ